MRPTDDGGHEGLLQFVRILEETRQVTRSMQNAKNFDVFRLDAIDYNIALERQEPQFAYSAIDASCHLGKFSQEFASSVNLLNERN
jgi:hypothetical protein